MKKLINSPGDVVPELLEGLTRLHSDLILMPEHMVVLRDGSPNEVAIISGGGSGHEPAHAGYVGQGLLRAAVAGDVFASPPTDAVLAAIRAVAGDAGILVVIKNYTGDRLNFGLAAELARAEGIRVETVVVDDDVALSANPQGVGRRGIAGTVLVHKVAGAAAADGADLATVAAEARDAIAALGSIGVALSSCTVPAAGAPSFTLGEDEIELGLGIHGEAGVHRLRMASAATLARDMLCRIVKDRDLHSGDRVALLVNNLGATPPSEMLIVCRTALAFLAGEGIVVERCWSGTFLTALDMQGCSLSLLRLDAARLARLDAPARAPAWPGPATKPGTPRLQAPAPDDTGPARATRNDELEAALRAVTGALRAAEAHLNALDRAAGDGDLGSSLARGARAIEDEMPLYDLARPACALASIAATVRRAVGGSSGPLCAIFLLRAAGALDGSDRATWADAFEAGWRAVGELGDAKPGDRTMLDALAPAAHAFRARIEAGESLPSAVASAANAAEAGTRATVSMTPRRGRSSYLADRVIGHPDPGAAAVATWLGALRDHFADAAL